MPKDKYYIPIDKAHIHVHTLQSMADRLYTSLMPAESYFKDFRFRFPMLYIVCGSTGNYVGGLPLLIACDALIIVMHHHLLVGSPSLTFGH
jgi:hypothetical protein